MELIKLILVGFVLGTTATIPGLSVATMAVAFNVYDRLINVIVPNVKKILGVWLFWLPLVIGGIVGIIFASKAFTVLFENYSIPTYWFFIGVITGSLPVVYSRVRQSPSALTKFALPSLPSAVCAVLAFAAIVVMDFLKPQEAATVYTELTLPVFGLLALAGALAAVAMIIPGISGAFLLLIIGLYRTVLLSVSDFNIPLLIPVVLGACAGLLIGAAFVRFLLLKVPRQTYGAVLGLIAGSIFVLFPGGFGEGIGIVISIVCLLAGFAISFFMGKQSNKEQKIITC
jgi:putative membrane protein